VPLALAVTLTLVMPGPPPTVSEVEYLPLALVTALPLALEPAPPVALAVTWTVSPLSGGDRAPFTCTVTEPELWSPEDILTEQSCMVPPLVPAWAGRTTWPTMGTLQRCGTMV